MLGRAALQAGWRPGEGVPVGGRARGRRGARPTARSTSSARPRRRARACAASSSPAPTRASARPSLAAALAAALRARRRRRGRVQAGGHGPRRARGRPPRRPRAARRGGGRARSTRSRRIASGRPSRRTWRPSWPARRSTRRRSWPHARGLRADVVVAEGVGGLLVPLTLGYTVRDLAVDLGWPVVVAARPGLGTINHSLLTVESARAAGLDVRAVVLTPWPAQPSVMQRSNRRGDRAARARRGGDARRGRPRGRSARARRRHAAVRGLALRLAARVSAAALRCHRLAPVPRGRTSVFPRLQGAGPTFDAGVSKKCCETRAIARPTRTRLRTTTRAPNRQPPPFPLDDAVRRRAAPQAPSGRGREARHASPAR